MSSCQFTDRENGRDAHETKRRSTTGFTAVEMLVVVFVMVVLGSILIPYVMTIREDNRRTQCADNMRQIRIALNQYATSNNFQYPRVVYDAANNPHGYTCFTGPDESNPFAAKSLVKQNDVTASLWLLVREGYIHNTAVFICPSSNDQRDPMTDASGRFVDANQRGNFRRSSMLSYGYSSPFSNAPRYIMDDTRPGDFAILADRGPSFGAISGHLIGPAHNAPPLQMATLNSTNHAGAGQNVLFADGNVRFERTPYCAAGRAGGEGGDNIYTVLSPTPLSGQTPPANGTGWWGTSVGPSWESDSYLVPRTDEGPR